MKKQLVVLALFATGLAGITAQESLALEGSVECPDLCNTDNGVCCDTPGGSTYYGKIS